MIYRFNNEEFESVQDCIKALNQSDNRCNAYKPWTLEEDEELLKLSKKSVLGLFADHFKRREGAIRARLDKYNSHEPWTNSKMIHN